MKFRSEYPKKEITIRQDQLKWLKNHKEINYSGFIQDQTDLLIKHTEKQNKGIKKETLVPTGRY